MREIKQLRIHCTNRKKGCNWKGELRALEDHLQLGKLCTDNCCEFVMVRCRNTGFDFNECMERVERRHLAQHMTSECLYRPYTCEHCGYEGTYMGITIGYRQFDFWGPYSQIFKALSVTSGFPSHMYRSYSHYDKCHMYPLKCPNNCGKSIERMNLDNHIKRCLQEPVDCPFKDAGCTDKIQRRYLENHIESNTQEHLMLMLKSHQELMKANTELKARIEKLENKK